MVHMRPAMDSSVMLEGNAIAEKLARDGSAEFPIGLDLMMCISPNIS